MKVNQEVLEQVKRFMTELIPFNAWLGLQIESLEDGRARVSIPFRPEFVGDPFRKALHGGVIASLIDAAGGAAVWTTINPTDPISTLDMRVDYLQPGKMEPLVCEARVIRAGRRVAVTSMTAFHPSAPGHPIAEGRAVYYIRHRPPPPG